MDMSAHAYPCTLPVLSIGQLDVPEALCLMHTDKCSLWNVACAPSAVLALTPLPPLYLAAYLTPLGARSNTAEQATPPSRQHRQAGSVARPVQGGHT